jgi:bifunctional non-homologous end joining protein LigD
MVYYVFDLLHLDGFDTRAAPLIKRKRVLESFLAEASAPGIMYSDSLSGLAERVYRH